MKTSVRVSGDGVHADLWGASHWLAQAWLVVDRRGSAQLQYWADGRPYFMRGRWDWDQLRLDPEPPDHPDVAAVVAALTDWARTPEGQAWMHPPKPARSPQPPERSEMVRGYYRAAVLHGWTPSTFLQYTLRGRAKDYMGRYLDRLMRALQADEQAGWANRVRSVGGSMTWVPVSDTVEALEPVRDGNRLAGWMTATGVIMTPEEYLAAVGMAGPEPETA